MTVCHHIIIDCCNPLLIGKYMIKMNKYFLTAVSWHPASITPIKYSPATTVRGRPRLLTSFRAHILVMEPMLLVMVTSVALARSSLDTDSLFSFDIMLPKLPNQNTSCDWKFSTVTHQTSDPKSLFQIKSFLKHIWKLHILKVGIRWPSVDKNVLLIVHWIDIKASCFHHGIGNRLNLAVSWFPVSFKTSLCPTG